MNLYEFNSILSLNDRAQAVWDEGQFLSNRLDGEYKVCLYYMGDFFAEVWVSSCDSDSSICHVRAFKSRRLLEPYLSPIDLSTLF
ncbi:hypothetical protein C8E01_117105 [Pontibacter virosus]|uniref:Uncharacterized protein n=1 Tax=Pontibacter virosus TaxID=1765052 RepID=A0A2U1APU0_9BACT|nr:hypothetical protein C8E01_117105 [Pontibacter virosus]